MKRPTASNESSIFPVMNRPSNETTCNRLVEYRTIFEQISLFCKHGAARGELLCLPNEMQQKLKSLDESLIDIDRIIRTVYDVPFNELTSQVSFFFRILKHYSESVFI